MVRMEKVDSQYAHFIPSICGLVEEAAGQAYGLSNTRAKRKKSADLYQLQPPPFASELVRGGSSQLLAWSC